MKPQQAAKGVPNNTRISAGPLFEEPEDLYGGPLVMDLDKRICRFEDPKDYQRLICACCASVVGDALGKYLPECSLLATGFPRGCFQSGWTPPTVTAMDFPILDFLLRRLLKDPL